MWMSCGGEFRVAHQRLSFKDEDEQDDRCHDERNINIDGQRTLGDKLADKVKEC